MTTLNAQTTQRPNIVIIGGGAGGLELATRLGHQLGKTQLANITLIDQNRVHLWKPLLHEIASGALDTGHEALSYRAHSADNHYYFRLGKLAALDTQTQTITLSPLLDHHDKLLLPERQVDYDYLVIAVGAHSNDFGTPGVRENCYTLDQAAEAEDFHLTLLNRFLQFSEITSAHTPNPTVKIAIVGAGATGVELAAELYNAVDRLEQFGIKNIHHQSLQVQLIEAADRILPVLPETLAHKAHLTLEELGVNVATQVKVESIEPNQINASHNGTPIHYDADLIVWAAGVKAPKILSTLGLTTNRINQIEVNSHLQAKGFTNLYAIGDCCSYLAENAPHPAPATAQAAHQMADICAANLVAEIKNQPLKEFTYEDHGTLISLSHFQTFGSLFANLLGRKNWFIEGEPAHLAYASLYRQHQYTLHGPWKTFWMMVSHWVEKRIKPKLKLY